MTLRIIIILTLFFASLAEVPAQSIPVGIPHYDDYARRQQLLGDSLQPASLMIRPAYQTTDAGKKFVIKAMPLLWKQRYTSDRPEGFSDGAMIPARGYQTLVSGGVFVKMGMLSVQLMPELLYARNLPFDGFPDEHPDKVWGVYAGLKNNIDLPDRFGDTPYKRFYAGQSAVRLTWRSLSLGISSENLWWGPGNRTAILMSNNAPGFAHLTFNTVKPIATPVGKFEFQIIGGRLEASGFPGIDSLTLAKHKLKFRAMREDWRYLNAMTVNYQPRWMPGLSVGGIRGFTTRNSKIKKNYRYLFPVLEPFFKFDVGGEKADTTMTDQEASVYIRWLMPRSNTEIYFEFGRTDHNWDFIDFAQEPDHYRAYLAGFRKLIPIHPTQKEFLDFQFEVTKYSRSYVTSLRVANTPGAWHMNQTHYGQSIASGIGISSNLQWMSLSWVRDRKKIGVEFQRLAHDEDFWAFVKQKFDYGDSRSHWVDLSTAAVADWEVGSWLLSARLQGIGAINYMHLYQPDPGSSPFWQDKGKIRWNVLGELMVAYVL